MSGAWKDAGAVTGTDRLRRVLRGAKDRRVRATWRVVLAWPVLWYLAGTAGVAAAAAVVPADVSRPTTMLGFGLFQAGFSGAAWVAWARYLDRRPLADYGLSPSRSWLVNLAVGFGTVLVGFGAWLAAGSALGWISVDAPAAPASALGVGLVAVFLAVLVNVWVQELVFVGVTVRNAAEGLASRGAVPSRAVVGAWVVAVSLFALKHRPPTPERALNLLLALGVFGLLYVHSGELALPIGVHAGVNFAGNALVASGPAAGDASAVFVVTRSLTGIAGSLSAGAIPQILVAYLLALGWLRWRRGPIAVDTDLARRPER